jgi:hypothetical protein
MNGKDRRTTELGLILLGLVIIGAAYTLASLGSRASLPADVVPFLAMVVALVIVAHIAVRRLAPNADGIILPVVALLNGLGYVFIARIDQDLAIKQAGWTAVGVVAFVATLALVRKVKTLANYGYTLLFIGLGLLLLPLLPVVGKEINGARIWINLGGFSVQPAEFAKIALILFFATYLVKNRELLGLTNWRLGPLHLPAPKFLAPVILAWGVALLVMIAQKDLGSALLFFVLFLSMMWIATERLIYPVMGGLLFAAGAHNCVVAAGPRTGSGDRLAESLGCCRWVRLPNRPGHLCAGVGRHGRPGLGQGLRHTGVGQGIRGHRLDLRGDR